MKTSSITTIIIALIIIVGAVWYFSSQPAPSPLGTSPTSTAPTGTQAPTTTPTTTGSTASAPMSATVHYTASGFSPATVTIAEGGSVTFVADPGAGSMWVASGVHPTHAVYDGTSRTEHCAAGYTGPAPFDECAAGSTFTFTFDKVGSWQYHNHLDASNTGTVVVQ